MSVPTPTGISDDTLPVTGLCEPINPVARGGIPLSYERVLGVEPWFGV